MTGATEIAGCWMRAGFAFGDYAVVAVAANANHLVVVDFGGGLPRQIGVAGFAIG